MDLEKSIMIILYVKHELVNEVDSKHDDCLYMMYALKMVDFKNDFLKKPKLLARFTRSSLLLKLITFVVFNQV